MSSMMDPRKIRSKTLKTPLLPKRKITRNSRTATPMLKTPRTSVKRKLGSRSKKKLWKWVTFTDFLMSTPPPQKSK